MEKIFSLSSGRSSSFMGLEFGSTDDKFLFALVEGEVYDYHRRGAVSQRVLEAHDFVRSYLPHFWSTLEDDDSLIVIHELNKALESVTFRQSSIDVVSAHQYCKKANYDQVAIKYLPNSRKRMCTEELKVLPIFHHVRRWHKEPVEMCIGFRLDEMERTVNLYFKTTPIANRKANPDFDLTSFVNENKIPRYLVAWWERMEVEERVRKGILSPKQQNFNYTNGVFWRVPSFPLIEHKIVKSDVVKYFKDKPQYPFPSISNCVGCFHHSVKELQEQFSKNPNKMEWFCRQEDRTGKTWINNIRYRAIESMPEQTHLEFATSCDSAGCTD